MHPNRIPGELPHTPPSAIARQRLRTLTPYVREANKSVRHMWHIPPRKLFDYLLLLIVESDDPGGYEIGGKDYEANVGDLFWIPPDTEVEMLGPKCNNTILYIHFDLIYDPERSHWSAIIPNGITDLSAWPERMHPPVGDPIIGNWCGKLSGHNPAYVAEIMQRIIMEYSRTQISNLTVEGLVLQLLGHLLGQQQEDSPLNDHHAHAIINAMRHIQLHSHGKLNVETLARQHGLSPTHFRKLFREHYGQNPRTAHLNAKMKTAGDFLVYTDLSISEIADRLNFTNVHNFSRAFRKAIGKSPSAYRKGI